MSSDCKSTIYVCVLRYVFQVEIQEFQDQTFNQGESTLFKYNYITGQYHHISQNEPPPLNIQFLPNLSLQPEQEEAVTDSDKTKDDSK